MLRVSQKHYQLATAATASLSANRRHIVIVLLVFSYSAYSYKYPSVSIILEFIFKKFQTSFNPYLKFSFVLGPNSINIVML